MERRQPADTRPLDSPELPQFWGSGICQLAKEGDRKARLVARGSHGQVGGKMFPTGKMALLCPWPWLGAIEEGAAWGWGRGAGGERGRL